MSYIKRIKRSLRGCRPRLSFSLDLFEEEYCLDFFGFLIALPFLDRWHREPEEMMESWGFSVYWADRYVVWRWGSYWKSIDMPWAFRHLITEVRKPDGTWVEAIEEWTAKEGESDGRWKETYDYTYTLKSGEIQHRKADIHVRRMTWVWRWTYWLKWPRKVRTSIDIRFDDEVGERTGSWKGGCTGCGWDLKPNETPLESLRRMERERVFD